MADINLVYPYEFEGGKKAIAAEVNGNFEAVKAFSNGINATIADLKKAITDLSNKPTREAFDVYYSFSGETPTGAYPLWTGETINNCKSLYPQFWKKLTQLADKKMIPSLTSSEYEDKLEKYGQCASFYIDALNGHVRLPKITKFISSVESLTDLAKEENAGLPNITGTIAYDEEGSAPTGAFKNAEKIVSGASGRGEGRVANFDASLSNELYGASETVQVPSVKLCLYLQVANNLGEISELNVDVVIEQMNAALAALQTAYEKYSTELETLYKRVKQDILNSSPVIKEEQIAVTTAMFVADETYAEYPFKVDIMIEQSLDANVPTVNFALEQIESGNYAPVAIAGDGYVRIYAKEVPETGFTIPSVVLQ